VLADGTPGEVLAREGRALAASGIWVPGFAPERPARSRQSGRELLHTDELAVGREAALPGTLDLAISAGDCLGITGPNGAGKSTLGLTIGGLLRPRSGRVVAGGLAGSLGDDPLRWKSRELVGRIGNVFQDPEHQFVASTVLAELRVGATAVDLSPTETAARVDPLLERLRLGPLAEANPFTLSGGEKRRLSVATALVTRPPLLVLDEPTFGQDARTWAELVALLAELLDRGSGVVAITHDVDLVDALADTELRMPRLAGHSPRVAAA
jgi:energy-coupling factor transporter ATP-binding protein EcfA2